MKNKAIAILGIGTFFLIIMAAATHLAGNFKYQFVLILMTISLIGNIIFTIIAPIFLWKIKKIASVLLISTSLLVFILALIRKVASDSLGSPFIYLWDIANVIYIIIWFWVIWLLWTTPKQEIKTEQTIGLKTDD